MKLLLIGIIPQKNCTYKFVSYRRDRGKTLKKMKKPARDRKIWKRWIKTNN